jgi:diguanylate cyclase (GGDEF)-like protein
MRRPEPPSAARLSRAHVVLLGVLGLLTAAVPVYLLVPLPEDLHLGLYDAIAAAAIAVGIAGLRLNRPDRARGWALVLAGYAGWVIGDIVWTVEQHLLPDQYPAPSDVPYLGAYLLIGAGALVFARSRRATRDLPALLDASIVTVGAGTIVAVFLLAPLAADTTSSLAARVVGAAYPLGDLFLLSVLLRVHWAPSGRTTSYRLLTASIAVTMVADAAYNVFVSSSPDGTAPGWLDAGWLAGYLLVAAAACLPSMTAVAEPAPHRAERTPSRRRLAVLTGGLVLPGVTLLVDGATGGGVQWPVIGTAALLLSVLVFLRMNGLLQLVQVQAVRLAALAHSDPLTGAPNRRTWDLELSRACQTSREQGAPLAVAILDVDRFKAYNDTYGHQAGDRLLREAVAAWTEALPATAMLARYGGEEFAVLFPGDAAPTAAAALERLRAVTPDGQTFSAGVADWDPVTDPSDAVAAADEALYVAKRAGRDRVVVHAPVAAGWPRVPLPAFHVVVQPVVDLATFTVTGHEVLTRFTGPDAAGGVQEVFRAAHEAGVGDLLELAAVRAGMEKPGRPVGQDLYVNVSARTITSERFLGGLPARLEGVVVELCENTDDVELGRVAEAAARLRSRGARIALDDVGAGAQEFARLSALRPDIVKIDRSLVSGCAHDRGKAALLRALVSYADEMGLSVCGEGVEDTGDLHQLTALGVTHAQGYLLGRPGPQWAARAGDRTLPTGS